MCLLPHSAKAILSVILCVLCGKSLIYRPKSLFSTEPGRSVSSWRTWRTWRFKIGISLPPGKPNDATRRSRPTLVRSVVSFLTVFDLIGLATQPRFPAEYPYGHRFLLSLPLRQWQKTQILLF